MEAGEAAECCDAVLRHTDTRMSTESTARGKGSVEVSIEAEAVVARRGLGSIVPGSMVFEAASWSAHGSTSVDCMPLATPLHQREVPAIPSAKIHERPWQDPLCCRQSKQSNQSKRQVDHSEFKGV